MSATAGTPSVIVNNFNVFEAFVPITLAGSYPGTAAGDTLDLSGIVPSNSAPVYVDIQELPPAGTLASGVVWKFAPGTTQANGVLAIGSNLTEYTQASSYSAALTGAALRIRAWFPAY